MRQKTIFSLVWLVIVGLIVWGVIVLLSDEPEVVIEEPMVEEVLIPPFETSKTIGTSVEGRDIEVYTFGNGDRQLLFVGGIHGGYEWNSVLLAYEFVDYFRANQDAVPANVTVSIIPALNPDGLYAVVQKEGRFNALDIPADVDITLGRMNANNVDLNRNFDCKWQPESTWRNTPVSAGTAVFSEPEAIALRDYVSAIKPESVVFWHSKANAVYASECENGVLTGTLDVMSTYATAAGYKAIPTFDAYPITGDAEGWLASLGIPAVTVELETRDSTEWARNLAGMQALLTSNANDGLGQ